MSWFNDFFGTNKPILGMVHLLPLPNTPYYQGDLDNIYDLALHDALALLEGGVHGIIIENTGDRPFTPKLETEQVACLAALAGYIQQKISIPLGIDAVFSDYKASLACALAARGTFIRIPTFVDRVDSYSGVLEPCAAWAMRYRKQLNAEHIKILADIQVKYTRKVVPAPLEESALYAVASGADALIVTGTQSGNETPIDTIKLVKKSVTIPVIVGSGLNESNIKEQFTHADGAIVGTYLKTAGKIDKNKVIALCEKGRS